MANTKINTHHAAAVVNIPHTPRDATASINLPIATVTLVSSTALASIFDLAKDMEFLTAGHNLNAKHNDVVNVDGTDYLHPAARLIETLYKTMLGRAPEQSGTTYALKNI